MKHTSSGSPSRVLLVKYQAMVLAFADGACFTVASFCKAFGHKDNRHTRRAINDMVEAGLLYKAKSLYDDGHYRMVYAAQRTQKGM